MLQPYFVYEQLPTGLAHAPLYRVTVVPPALLEMEPMCGPAMGSKSSAKKVIATARRGPPPHPRSDIT